MKDHYIFNRDLLKKCTKINLFEKIGLYFCKSIIFDDGTSVLVSKVMRGKVYVISHFIKPPVHPNCRCQINKIREIGIEAVVAGEKLRKIFDDGKSNIQWEDTSLSRFQFQFDLYFWSLIPQVNINGHFPQIEFEWLCFAFYIRLGKL